MKTLQQIYDALDYISKRTNGPEIDDIHEAMDCLSAAIAKEESAEDYVNEFKEHNVWNKAQTGVR